MFVEFLFDSRHLSLLFYSIPARHKPFLFLPTVFSVRSDFVEPPEPETSLLSLADSQTRLPCYYQVEEGEQAVQVTWYRELPDGGKDPMITAHFTSGLTGRVE